MAVLVGPGHLPLRSPPAPVWDTPSLQPWFAQLVLGPTSCPFIAASPRSKLPILSSHPAWVPEPGLSTHKKSNFPCAIISRALGRTPIVRSGPFRPASGWESIYSEDET